MAHLRVLFLLVLALLGCGTGGPPERSSRSVVPAVLALPGLPHNVLGGFFPGNANGKATAANSQPVVLNTDAANAGFVQLSDGSAANSATHAPFVQISNGSAANGAVNPVLVQFTDGSAIYTGAKTGQLPSSLGAKARASSLSVTPATTTIYQAGAATIPIAGQQIVSGAGILRFSQVYNGSNGTIVWAFFDATAQPTTGTVPLLQTTATTLNITTTATTVIPFQNGLWFAVQTGLGTYAAVGGTTASITYSCAVEQ